MVKILDQENYIFVDEYCVLHFYQIKSTIKYHLVKKIVYIYVYIILYVMYFISCIHRIY